jgi:hypothetical protein
VKAAWLIVLTSTSAAMAAPPIEDRAAVIIIVVQPEAEPLVSSTALGAAIANDLQAPVATCSPAPAIPVRGVLTIGHDESRHLTLSYRDARGDEIRRVIRANDHDASLDEIALIAGNLIRNEAEEILAELTRKSAPLATDETLTPVAAKPTLTPEPMTITRVAMRAPSRAANRALAHPWSIGTLTYLSSRSAEPVYTPGSGLYVSRTVSRYFALGLTDMLVLPNEGHTVFSAGPYVEGFWFAKDWLQVFAQLGVPLQARWGGTQQAALGAQPFFGSGLRLWIGSHTSVAAAARVAVVATSVYDAPPTGIVQGTVSVSGGLELGFHL